jgi:hypothetical protein
MDISIKYCSRNLLSEHCFNCQLGVVFQLRYSESMLLVVNVVIYECLEKICDSKFTICILTVNVGKRCKGQERKARDRMKE